MATSLYLTLIFLTLIHLPEYTTWWSQVRADALPTQEPEYARNREHMVQTQILARGIQDSSVLRAMRIVQRHQFVPEELRGDAYDDGPLPIGFGQTISQPYIVAVMTELLHVKPGDRVLEIGTGSGYQAAVLGEICDSVWTIEIIDDLALSARNRLRRLGYNHVTVRSADGYYGWSDYGPFDAIMVTAAAEHIPPPLIAQLADNGRMVIPVGHPFFVQNLVLVQKQHGAVTTRTILPVRFVPLTRAQ